MKGKLSKTNNSENQITQNVQDHHRIQWARAKVTSHQPSSAVPYMLTSLDVDETNSWAEGLLSQGQGVGGIQVWECCCPPHPQWSAFTRKWKCQWSCCSGLLILMDVLSATTFSCESGLPLVIPINLLSGDHFYPKLWPELASQITANPCSITVLL